MNIFRQKTYAKDLWKVLGSFGELTAEVECKENTFSSQNEKISLIAKIEKGKDGVFSRNDILKNISSEPLSINTLSSKHDPYGFFKPQFITGAFARQNYFTAFFMFCTIRLTIPVIHIIQQEVSDEQIRQKYKHFLIKKITVRYLSRKGRSCKIKY